MSQTVNVDALFQTAHDEGVLSQDALRALTGVIDIGEQIQAGLGTPAAAVAASEVVLVTVLLDDSGSIRFSGNTQAVRDGHNGVIDALNASKQSGSVLFYTRYLNGKLINPYRPLAQAERLDAHNYNPNGDTPLYDQTLVTLGTVLAKSQEFADNGVPVRTVTLIVTDGEDTSSRAGAKKIRPIIQDMLMAETHIVAAMGIGESLKEQSRFHHVFEEMGIRPEWILTPSTDQHAIRQAFNVFSQSAVRASQSAMNFGQAAVGGFGS
jgi:hypothetical protein